MFVVEKEFVMIRNRNIIISSQALELFLLFNFKLDKTTALDITGVLGLFGN